MRYFLCVFCDCGLQKTVRPPQLPCGTCNVFFVFLQCSSLKTTPCNQTRHFQQQILSYEIRFALTIEGAKKSQSRDDLMKNDLETVAIVIMSVFGESLRPE